MVLSAAHGAMPCIPAYRFSDRQDDCRPDSGEIKSGVLEIVRNQSKGGHQRVFVRVYRTSSEHFAVLFPVRALITACKPLASINLRSCTVDYLSNSGREFRINPKPSEGVALDFSVPESVTDKDSVKSWIMALTMPMKTDRKRTLSDPNRVALPVLEEEEEGC